MVTDRLDPERDITPLFVAKVADWLASSDELFVVLRYLRSAGAKDYAFIRDDAEFQQLVHACSDGTDIIVFRDSQLPIRGTATPELITDITNQIPDGEEYLAVCTSPQRQGDLRLSGSIGDSHSSLIEDLTDFVGRPVAVGLCPRFIDADNYAMISASKGGIDGPR
jgi:hypothetical protein